MGNNAPKQLSGRNSEDTFFRIKPFVVCSKVVEGEAEIIYQCLDRFCLDEHVVHVCFDCLADLFFQASLDHTLVSSPSIFGPEGHSVEAEGTVRG